MFKETSPNHPSLHSAPQNTVKAVQTAKHVRVEGGDITPGVEGEDGEIIPGVEDGDEGADQQDILV